jgi:hypothetical protein
MLGGFTKDILYFGYLLLALEQTHFNPIWVVMITIQREIVVN